MFGDVQFDNHASCQYLSHAIIMLQAKLLALTLIRQITLSLNLPALRYTIIMCATGSLF